MLHANRTYYALTPILRSHAVHRAENIKKYKSLIRPVITYGAEALNFETTKRLAVFERKVLRRILGAVKINDIWRRRNNCELMNLRGHGYYIIYQIKHTEMDRSQE